MVGQRIDSQPCSADGDGVMRLLRGIKYLLDAFVVPGISPGFQQAAHRIKLEDMLQRQGNLVPED